MSYIRCGQSCFPVFLRPSIPLCAAHAYRGDFDVPFSLLIELRQSLISSYSAVINMHSDSHLQALHLSHPLYPRLPNRFPQRALDPVPKYYESPNLHTAFRISMVPISPRPSGFLLIEGQRPEMLYLQVCFVFLVHIQIFGVRCGGAGVGIFV